MKSFIFTSDEVNAALEGRKTLHVVPLKVQIDPEDENEYEFKYAGDGERLFCVNHKAKDQDKQYIRLPIAPCEKIYIREAWARAYNIEYMEDFPYGRPYTNADHVDFKGKTIIDTATIYSADGAFEWVDDDGLQTNKSYWKSPVCMPEWAARLFFTVKSVRVCRVQELTSVDAYDCGITASLPACLKNPKKYPDGFRKWPEEKQKNWCYGQARMDYIAQCGYSDQLARNFIKAWNERHGKKYPWNSNPFVAVYELERKDGGNK